MKEKRVSWWERLFGKSRADASLSRLIGAYRAANWGTFFRSEAEVDRARELIRCAGAAAVDTAIRWLDECTPCDARTRFFSEDSKNTERIRARTGGDKDDYVFLIKLLASIGDERAVAPLLRHFRASEYSSLSPANEIAEFFGRIKTKEGAHGLVPYLDCQYHSTRRRAAYGLGLLALDETREALRLALERYEWVKEGLEQADTEFAKSVLREWDATCKATGPPIGRRTGAESEIEKLVKQIMSNEGGSISNRIKRDEMTAKLVQCGMSAAPTIRRILFSTPLTSGVHFSNAATLCRVLGQIGGRVAQETLDFLVRADSDVGEFHQILKPAAHEALASLSTTAGSRAGAPLEGATGHYYQGRVPQRGEGVICFACGKTFDGNGPLWVDIMARERWFCPEETCIAKIRDAFAGKCTWCEEPLPASGPEITGSGMGDNFCSESCRDNCGMAIDKTRRRMGQ